MAFVIHIKGTRTVDGNVHPIREVAQYAADRRKTWDGGWYGKLGKATLVFKRRGNAERWLRERGDVAGTVMEDPRSPDSALQ